MPHLLASEKKFAISSVLVVQMDEGKKEQEKKKHIWRSIKSFEASKFGRYTHGLRKKLALHPMDMRNEKWM